MSNENLQTHNHNNMTREKIYSYAIVWHRKNNGNWIVEFMVNKQDERSIGEFYPFYHPQSTKSLSFSYTTAYIDPECCHWLQEIYFHNDESEFFIAVDP